MNRSDVWPKVLACLCLAGLALAWLGSEALRLTAPDSVERSIDLAALALGGVGFLIAGLVLARHFRDAPPPEAGEAAPGVFLPPLAAAGALPAVLRCLEEPALVVSERGRVLQANPAAAVLDPLGRPGGDIGEVVEPSDWRQALAKARSERRPARVLLRRRDGLGDLAARVADLGFQAGAVVIFDVGAAPLRPPVRPGGRWGAAFDPGHPLAALPMAVLRLIVADGRVTDIATVKLAGGRVFPTLSLEFAVAQPELDRPGRPFAEIWPVLAQALTGAAVVAEHAGQVWAALQAELAAAGFAVVEAPPLLDLRRLAAAYDPAWAEWGVDQLALALNLAEPDPVRRLARVAAALVMGREGQGLGRVGDFIGENSAGETGGSPDDALKPGADAPASGEAA